MHFLNLVSGELCCPPERMSLKPGPALFCEDCRTFPIPDLFEYVERPVPGDFFRSGLLAGALADWIGSEEVPVSFPVSHVDGILDVVVRKQSLRRVRRSVRLLRAIHAPFTTDPVVARSCPEDMRTFLADFLDILHEHPHSETADERVALEALMRNMHDLVTCREAANPFETYFNVLVPYVQTCSEWQPFDAEAELSNPASELHLQLVRSHLIRTVFGRYAVPFDVIHVMVCCYACSSDAEVVGNWAIDFLARMCRGDFDWKRFADSPFVVRMQKLIHSQFNYKTNRDVYHKVVKPILRGESIDQYSVLWRPYHEMLPRLREGYRVPGVWSSDVLDVAFAHAFPAVLFQDHADQLGFAMGMNHLVTSANRQTGELPTGAFKKARAIHDVVRRFVRRVQDFHEDDVPRKEDRLVWNLETVRLFFASDPQFHDEIMRVLRVLLEGGEV